MKTDKRLPGMELVAQPGKWWNATSAHVFSCFYTFSRNQKSPQLAYFLGQWFSTEGTLSPKGHLGWSGNIFDWHNPGSQYCWHLVGQRPQRVLNILKHTGLPLPLYPSSTLLLPPPHPPDPIKELSEPEGRQRAGLRILLQANTGWMDDFASLLLGSEAHLRKHSVEVSSHSYHLACRSNAPD